MHSNISFDEPDWLISHHRAKEHERRAAICEFGIREDDEILDIGCGPGLWTAMIAEHLGSGGKILGVDSDESQINKAKSIVNGEKYICQISFETLRFDEISDELGRFDKVFCINTLPYCDDPVALAERIRRENLNSKGQIIIRNWDQSTLLMHPLPEQLIAKVKHLLCTASKDQLGSGDDVTFDDNFGRKIPGIIKRAGFKEIRACSQLIERHECDDDLGVYVRANGYWMANQVQPYLSDKEYKEFLTYFDPENKRFIGKSPDFYLSIVEHTIVGING